MNPIHGFEQVHLDFLDNVLGIGVGGSAASGVTIQQLAVTLVELMPTQLVGPLCESHYEGQMCALRVIHDLTIVAKRACNHKAYVWITPLMASGFKGV